MEEKDLLTSFYESFNEDVRLYSKCGMVEYLTTIKYIEKYLKPQMQIIEIGAGTGRYSHRLAQHGYQVDAVELVDHNIELFKKHTVEGENISIVQGSAVNLSSFQNNYYDITLLLGPMYHLYTQADKLKALSEAIRITKKDGLVFAAYCMSDPAVLSHGFISGNIANFIEQGLVDPNNFNTNSCPKEIFELYRKEEIKQLRSNFDVTPLHFIATDGYANHMREAIEKMDEQTYNLYLQYHFSTCERQDLIGYSHHTLDIFKKNY